MQVKVSFVVVAFASSWFVCFVFCWCGVVRLCYVCGFCSFFCYSTATHSYTLTFLDARSSYLVTGTGLNTSVARRPLFAWLPPVRVRGFGERKRSHLNSSQNPRTVLLLAKNNLPLLTSSFPVPKADPRVSTGLSKLAYKTTYAPIKPSNYH